MAEDESFSILPADPKVSIAGGATPWAVVEVIPGDLQLGW